MPALKSSRHGRKESLQHPWQPARLNGWNGVCSLLHSLRSTSCTNQTEEPCEPPARCSTNITSQAIIAGQGSVYAHNHCHKEQSSTQQDKPPSGRALEMLQVRPPADCVLLKGPLDKSSRQTGAAPATRTLMLFHRMTHLFFNFFPVARCNLCWLHRMVLCSSVYRYVRACTNAREGYPHHPGVSPISR